jgi:hypothetical protein
MTVSLPELELQLLDEHRFEERAELFAEDGLFSMPGVVSSGRASIRAEGDDNPFVQGLEGGVHVNDHIYVDGSTTIVEGAYRGVHVALLRLPIGDIPPTGQPISVPYALIYEIADGLIQNKRAYFDWGAFARPADDQRS